MTDWTEYRTRIEAELAEARKDLEPLENGTMTLGERQGSGPWRDVTAEWIAHHKRTISIYESILAAITKRPGA